MSDIDYDLEFLEDGHTIELISIGMVADDGREYYAVNSEMPVDRILANHWLKANVWPHLPLRGYKPWPQINALQVSDGVLDLSDSRVKPRFVIANEVRDFIQATDAVTPKLWADYGAYDHVALCQLWGTMARLPLGVPMWTHDLQQEIERLGIDYSELPQQMEGAHDALADARHNRTVRLWLGEHERSLKA
ncbi:3'-5' exoribonuclease domain-containing protein [Streptomyces sp.]|uniref:3'-5' exoribonuclease domain-containing protein n=1 Tax=Streptomyces sp. TaxID=1931 RepID=UPI002F402C99